MARDFAALLVLNAVLTTVTNARASTLAPVGVKVVDMGEFQVPTQENLAAEMPQVIGRYVGFQGGGEAADKPADALIGTHIVQLAFFRLLGDLEKKNVKILEEAELIAELFTQGRFSLTVSDATGVRIRRCYIVEFEPGEGFLLDDVCDIEEFYISVAVEFAAYNRP